MPPKKKTPAKGRKSKAQPSPEPKAKVGIEQLPPEALDRIFAEAARGYSLSQKLKLSLISPALCAYGLSQLYSRLDFIGATGRTHFCLSSKPTWQKGTERKTAILKSISFCEKSLPSLGETRVRSLSLLTLCFSSWAIPGTWVLEQLAKLLRLFRGSKGTLHVLIRPEVLTTELITLFAETEKTAFAHVRVEIEGLDQQAPSASQGKVVDCILVGKAGPGPHGGLPLCDAWTQSQSVLTPSRIYRDGRNLVFAAASVSEPPTRPPLSLFQLFANASNARCRDIVFYPRACTYFNVRPLACFKHAVEVSLPITYPATNKAQFVQILQSVSMPLSTASFVIASDKIVLPVSELFLQLMKRDWAPSVKSFHFIHETSAGVEVAACDSELALEEGGVSWRSVYATVLAERGAKLEIWDGQTWRDVASKT